MCLSIPSKVVHIDEHNMATVDTMGVERKVTLDLMSEEVAVGDYILIHIGYAMTKMSEEEAVESLKMYEMVLKELESQDEPN